jgi:signal transduction histidine kinase
MSEQPDYNELMEYAKYLEAKVASLEDALKQFQNDGTRVKTRFLSNISHDIRTPMNAIIGFSHLLGEEDVDVDQREAYINHITRNGNSLLNMMDNLIDLTLIETGALQLKGEEVEIYPMMKELYDLYNTDR